MGHIDSMQLGDFTHPAFSTVHSTMLAAKHLIDETFGQGFAQANPILLAAFINASTRHLISELEAGLHHVRSVERAALVSSTMEAVDTLSEEMGRIADALEPR